MTREDAIDEIDRTKDSYYSTITPDLEHCLTTDECEEIVNKIYDHFEQKESDLRAEFQKKIAEINLEHDSQVCSECEWCVRDEMGSAFKVCMQKVNGLMTEYEILVKSCTKFKKKQQCAE